VLVAKYEVEGNHIRGGANTMYGWWRDLIGVREGVEMVDEGGLMMGWWLELEMVKIYHSLV